MKTTHAFFLFYCIIIIMLIWYIDAYRELKVQIQKRDSVNTANIGKLDSIKRNYEPIIICPHQKK